MKRNTRILLLCMMPALLLPQVSFSQTDSTQSLLARLTNLEDWMRRDTTDLVFTGTRLHTASDADSINAGVTISGYVDFYYARYTDDTGLAFEKFPTIAPRNNAFSLNLLQLSAKYENEKIRGMATLHAGDMVLSSWSPQFSMIQEANAGLRLLPKLWFDGGFFRSHIGVESVQPRENITSTVATTTYFEPYFFSGVKLTWSPTPEWNFQLNAFNGYNTFVENNRSKDFGLSVNWNPGKTLSFTLNSIAGNDSVESLPLSQFRVYNNFFFTVKAKKLQFAGEGNFGWQEHAALQDSSKHAIMYSALLSVRYRFTPWFATYARGEIFEDSNEILTGPVQTLYHKLTGINIWGVTGGIELRPNPVSYFRIEGRRLQTQGPEEIFLMNDEPSRVRYEGVLNMGVWF